jgi:uncharacterized SAM-binding protein YcdF (DUF218 family)
VRRPSSVRARRFLTALVLGYWLLSTRTLPAVLVALLSAGFAPLQTAQAAHGADVIVVLSGGAESYREAGVTEGVPLRSTVLRALEAARLFRVIGARRIIASGGAVDPAIHLMPESVMVRNALVDAGVPADRIIQESSSRSTREQVRGVKALLDRDGTRAFILVTSPTHMRRAVATFRASGLDPIPSLAPLASDHAPAPSWIWPNDEALYRSDLAIYDSAALAYYWSIGALSPGPPAAR